MILSDDDSDSIEDGKEFNKNYVEMTEGDSACAEDATSDGYSCNEMDGTDRFLMERTGRIGLSKTYYTYSTQMIKYSEKIGRGYWPSEEHPYALRNMELSHYR